ncbi:MAG TPA: FUSC family protein [Acidiphilium sp.]|nr:MAG: hypothetical protein B7Z67_11645 [Acidiphilium sp. 21-60-14]OYV90803.1 MAG: hypothetical protein B7Z57_07415 [Acidiphilium sp. 37-60-79]HQT87344.1 FUSC family protein [Acidiphilium sp.]HQU24698.1 FUSC family protein [Acidiphilium sp.]
MAQANAFTTSIRPGTPNFRLDLRAISLLEGLRAAIAIAVTMALGAILHIPLLGIAALGALLACFADPGGPVRTRLIPILLLGLLGGLAFALLPPLLAFAPACALLVGAILIFAGSLSRIYGQGGMQFGNLFGVATVLALDRPSPSFALDASIGAIFAAGAFWAALLTLGLWRMRPHAPARAALARTARALAALSLDLADISTNPSETAFDRHASQHRRAVREAIEQARAITLITFRRQGAASVRGNRIALRLATLDLVFEALIALSDSLTDPADPSTAAPALQHIAGFLTGAAPDIADDRPLTTPERSAALDQLRHLAITAPARTQPPLRAIAEHLSVLLTSSAPPGADPTLADARPPIIGTALQTLRANLTWNSVSLRHATRTACIIVPVLFVMHRIHNPFGHWLAITMILTLQPHFSATWIRAAERVGGTVAGGILAALIGLICTTPLAISLTMVPLALAAFAVRGANFSAFVAILTPMIVLLIEQIAPGTSPRLVALSRIGFTLLGGLLAIAANLLLWPSFETNRLAAASNAAITAHQAYLRATFASLTEPAQATLAAARRAAGLASNNLEASIARALAEPHRGTDPELRRAVVVDATLRRMAGRLVSLRLATPSLTRADGAWLEPWVPYLTNQLDAPAPAQTQPPLIAPAAPTSLVESLARLSRQVELISAQMHENQPDHG